MDGVGKEEVKSPNKDCVHTADTSPTNVQSNDLEPQGSLLNAPSSCTTKLCRIPQAFYTLAKGQCGAPGISARLFKPCSVGARGSMGPLTEHHARQIHLTLSREASLLLEKNEFSAKKPKHTENSWCCTKTVRCSWDKDPGDVHLSRSPTTTNQLCALRQVILNP